MPTFIDLLAQQRAHIQWVVQAIARANYLSREEAAEFAHVVFRKLEQNDYAKLREFDGRSTWETFLSASILEEFFPFQRELWGSWQPSNAAIRSGPAALLLEELIIRDRLAFAEAVRVMRTSHGVDVPDYRLEEIYRTLRLGDRVSATAEDTDLEARKRAINEAMTRAFKRLSVEDQLLLRLRYTDRAPLTQIARLLRHDARPVQRQIEQAREVFRQQLLQEGVQTEEIEALLANADTESERKRRKWWHIAIWRPSNE